MKKQSSLKKDVFENLDIQDGDKVYAIVIRPSEKGWNQQRFNHGFNPYELLGISQVITREINDQLSGIFKPDITVTKRTYMK